MSSVLIVEDEAIVAKDIEQTITSFGYSVCGISHTGEDAVKKIYQLKPDIILLDIMLRGSISGIEVAEKIRKDLDTPIIFVTAYKNKEIIQKAKHVNPSGYIFKPFERKELQINIELALYKHSLEKKLKKNESFLFATMNNISDGIITTNNRFEITFINKSAENIFNTTKDEIISKNINTVIPIYRENNKVKEKIDFSNNSNFTNIKNKFVLSARNKDVFLNVSISEVKSEDTEDWFLFNFSDITEKHQSKEIINMIVDSTTSSIGDEFFKSLVKSVAKILKVKFAFVCDYPTKKKNIARVIAAWENDSYTNFKNYNIKNTPSEKVVKGNFVFFKDNIQELFPMDKLLKRNELRSYMAIPIRNKDNKVIGHMGVMNDEPMRENKLYESIFKFLSERASAELQRKRSEEDILKNEKKYKVLAKKYENLLDSLPQAVFEIDNKGQFTFANKFAFKAYNLSIKELNKGVNVFDIIDSVDAEKAKSDFSRALNGEDVGFNEYLSKRKDGASFTVLSHATRIINEQSKNAALRIFIIDISDMKKMESALKDSEERYSLTLKGTNDGFWDWTITTGKIYFSPKWKEMLGYEENELNNLLDEWFSRVHPEDLQELKIFINRNINESSDYFECEYRIKSKADKYIWMHCRCSTVKDKDGKVYRLGGSQTDISKHKSTQGILDDLLHSASHDLLTGLPNRSLFLEKLEKSINSAKRKKDSNVSVMYIDIDRFKLINDSLGHSFGNIFLVEFAKKLKLMIPDSCVLARIEGDEFAILIEAQNSQEMSLIFAKKIERFLHKPFLINNQEVFSSVSIGIAYSLGNESSEDVIRSADIARGRAKALGRSRYEIFDSGMQTSAMETFQIETDLRYAIERNELIVYYQPIISLETGKIIGFEALLRWFHKNRGLVPSDLFIPIAEETGYIIKIGKWVLRQAATQIKYWNDKYKLVQPLTVNVNISGKQFSYPSIVKHISQIIAETNVNPRQIKLEITESSLMDNAEKAREMLEKLKETQLQLQIDDFGTGYSSLSYLHRFPADTLKIDRSFVSRIGSNDENLEIVKTIVLLAKNLNMKTTAEGIETEEQLLKLRSLNCDYGQGYLFSKAIPVDQVELLIESDPRW